MTKNTKPNRNNFTVFLKDKRYMTLSLLANKLELSVSSLRNTVYGIKPIKLVVVALKDDAELFDLLPEVSRNLLNDTVEDEKAS